MGMIVRPRPGFGCGSDFCGGGGGTFTGSVANDFSLKDKNDKSTTAATNFLICFIDLIFLIRLTLTNKYQLVKIWLG